MGKKLRLLAALLISVLPLNRVRVFFYGVLPRYRISSSARIGFGTILAVSEARIGSVSMGAFNRFQGPFSLLIEDGATIGGFNTFSCLHFALPKKARERGFRMSCKIGRDALITSGHFVDVSGGFELGESSWIAGLNSQFWTHGALWLASVDDWSVIIGSHCYIGSAVRFTPGSAVGNHTLVAIGSVVTKKFRSDHLLIGGAPAEIIKTNWDWKTSRPEA